MPSTVAGRPMVTWSVAGPTFWAAAGDARAKLAWGPALEGDGLDSDAVEMAVAGRADKRDPPYIIWAVKFGDHPGKGLPPAAYGLAMGVMHVDGNQGEDWREVVIENVQISAGNSQMVGRRHQGGLPHVMYGTMAIYGFITNDGAWASEVVMKLRDVLTARVVTARLA